MNFTDIEYLPYLRPYNWDGVLDFLRGHVTQGIEAVDGDAYIRTVAIDDCVGAVRVTNAAERTAICVEYTESLRPVATALACRLRRLFDTEFDPQAVNEFLAGDPLLAPAIARNPGMRIPGAFDHFELLVRSILGQQISIKAANTLSGRFTRAFGKVVNVGDERITRIGPSAERIAQCGIDEITILGIVRARAVCIIAVAEAVAGGRVAIEDGDDPEIFISRVTMLRGIGPWTAHYLAMRALHWTDAFPKEDIALRTMLGNVKASEAERRSQVWRPWRSYAVMHIWQEYVRQRAPKSTDSNPEQASAELP